MGKVKRFDWAAELQSMHCPALLYWGSEDRHAKGLRRAQQLLRTNDVEFVEYAGLGHEAGGNPEIVANLVVPDVVEWTGRRLGSPWARFRA